MDESAFGSMVILEVSDLGRPGRVAAVTVTVPPRAGSGSWRRDWPLRREGCRAR